ncbi:hypothetical protein DZB84_18360 [Bacillus sp. HNG]|nr:hypothetical protein DZB84_18360 [Bacillus sp. HNG]
MINETKEMIEIKIKHVIKIIMPTFAVSSNSNLSIFKLVTIKVRILRERVSTIPDLVSRVDFLVSS